MKHSMDFVVRTFVVVEPDPIVSMDLAGILKSSFPDSAVELHQNGAEAETRIATKPETVCIIINSKLATQGMLRVLKNCVGRGGHVVFVGPARDVGFPARFVEVPFNSGMVLDALSN